MNFPLPVSEHRPAPEGTPNDRRRLLPAFGDAIDFSELLAALRRNAKTILAVAVLTFAAVLAVTLYSPMQFVSSGRLYLGDLTAPVPSSPGEMDLMGTSQGDVTSEIEILRSRSLISEAILRSGANVTIEPLDGSRLRYYRWRLSGRDPKLLDVAERRVQVRSVGGQALLRAPRELTARFQSDGSYTLSADDTPLVQGKLGSEVTTSGLRLTLLEGKEGRPRAGDAYRIEIEPLDHAVDRIQKHLQVSAPNTPGAREPVKVVTLTISDASPRRAARFLEELMGGYLEQHQNWKTEHATLAEAFVTEQLEKLQGSLDEVETELAEYRSNNEGVVLDDKAQAMIAQLSRVEDQRVAAQLEVAALSDAVHRLKQPDSTVESYMFGEASDNVLEDMAESLAQARNELSILQTRYHEAAPAVRQQQQQVEALRGSIQGYVKGRHNRAQKNLATLNSIAAGFEKKLRTVPGAEIHLKQLSRKSDVYSTIHSYLLERKQQAAIVKASTVSKNRVLDTPDVSLRESSPRLALRLASAPLGVLLGIFLVMGMRVFGPQFQSSRDVQRAVGSLPVFAQIPRLASTGSTLPIIEDPQNCEHGATFVESFRALRANLYRAAAREGGTCVLLTSPNERDGKTTCVLALASMLAADQKSVLVIDANVRQPRYARFLSKARSSLLPGSAIPGWLDRRMTVPVRGGGFNVLFCGEGAPPEHLSNGLFAGFLQRMKHDYDFVLLDSSPYPQVTDSLVLAGLSDVCISVLRVKNTDRRQAAAHLHGLSSHESLALGVIINDTEDTRSGSPPPTEDPLGAEIFARTPGQLARRQFKRLFA